MAEPLEQPRMTTITSPFKSGTVELSREAVLRDYRIGWRSRHAAVLGRREVLGGRAKFGIFGDGKEVAQLAMAYAFKRGDWRSGYYRDQTFMMALGLLELEPFFAQIYAHADLEAEPWFGGRAMTGHFATHLIDGDGRWLPQRPCYNSAADLSPTAAQMPRLVGLAYASRLYRELEELQELAAQGWSHRGNEVAFGTIGNASCAEGVFWEAVNAVGVLQAPMLLSIWDDEFGISVPNKFQMTKGSVSKALRGFQRRVGGAPGLDLHTVPGWDYPRLCETYLRAADAVRRDHVPAIIHVTELTQPLGHSTSGSHERYKTPKRLEWERQHDCLVKMREWIVDESIAATEELDAVEEEEKRNVLSARDRAWEAFTASLRADSEELLKRMRSVAAAAGSERSVIDSEIARLERRSVALRRDQVATAQKVLIAAREVDSEARRQLGAWLQSLLEESRERYGSELYSSAASSALKVEPVAPIYSEASPEKNGFEILNACFDAALARHPNVVAMGEDVGQLGDVNQGFAHLQEKYGPLRVSDTGIRETTIIGQAIGMALRGLRPIAEIQYLDYILYALQILSDDLATLRWRTRGGQKAPVIIRTRGHRLEGIWHSGSPMAGVLHLIRGIYVCVPRDATQAAGFYNTLLKGDDAALVVEVLNAYRQKARLPDNIGEMCLPLGVPEVLRRGRDITVVTYGACCPIALMAAEDLATVGIEIEVIDVRTLLPFDRRGIIRQSLERTNRVVFLDEDVPGGGTAYMMREVLEVQGGYDWLDGAPRTLPAQPHRPAYGSDGDYFSKPNREDLFRLCYDLMREADPKRFRELFGG